MVFIISYYLNKYSIGYLLDGYADLCVTIIETFTAKQLYDLQLINEYYQKMNRYSGVHYDNHDMYVIVDNIDSIEYLLSFAKESSLIIMW